MAVILFFRKPSDHLLCLMDCVIEKALKAGNGEGKGRGKRITYVCVLRFIRDVFHFLSFF